MQLHLTILGLVIAALGVTWRAPAAHADGAVFVFGKAASAQQRQLIVASVQASARSDGWSFKSAEFNEPDARTVVGCLRVAHPWLCVESKMQGKGDRLVAIQVELERADTVLTVHVVTAANDSETKANHFCSSCDDAALKRAVADVTRQLLREAAEKSGKTLLAIRSTPDKAWITLDGKPAGATNVVKATYPGEHTVMFRRAGYETAIRTVMVTDGQTVDVSATLQPEASSAVDPKQPPVTPKIEPPSRLVPKLLFGFAAAAAVGGTVLLLTDEDPDPIGPQPETLRNTAPHGVISLVAATAAVGGGLYLWRRSTKTGSRASVSPVPVPGGAAVGLSGRF